MPVGAAWSIPGTRKLTAATFGDAGATGACCAAISNGWGCDPHRFQTPLLTVVVWANAVAARSGGSGGGGDISGSGGNGS